MTLLNLRIDVKLTDEVALRALLPDDLAAGPTAEILCHAILNARSSNNGIVLLDTTRAELREGSGSWTLVVAVEVVDTDLLIAEASARREACWGEAGWTPETLCQAVFEVVAASNDNPCPNEAGYEFGRVEYLVDATACRDAARCS